MNVSILGIGNMAKGLVARFLAGGNTVTLFTRTAEKAPELTGQFAAQTKNDAALKINKLGDPLQDEIVISSIPFPAVKETVQAHQSQLSGKILVDLSNLFTSVMADLKFVNTSAAEEIAKVVPEANVIKAFNTIFAATLAARQVGGEKVDIFLAGDDAGAKASLARLIESGGMHAIDAGSLKRARQLEGLALVWVGMQSGLEHPWQGALRVI